MKALLRIVLVLVVFAGAGVAGTAHAQTAGFVATVTSESTDLRKNASGMAPSIDTVLKGTELPAFGLSPDKKWVRVRAPDGSTVWVSRNDVKVAKASEAEAVPAATPPPAVKATPVPKATPKGGASSNAAGFGSEKKVAHVVVEKTKLQLNATKSSPTLSVARKNDQFEVGGFSRDGLWVKVRTDDGRIGYIQKADVRPGSAPTAIAAATPRPRPTPKPANDGFDDPNDGFNDNPPDDPPPRRRRQSAASDLTVWADGGLVLINETMTSNEGFGYKLSGSGYGAGVRFERRLGMMEGLFIEGGYLGTMNQRIPAPQSTTTVFSTLHRIDVSAKYKLSFVDDEGPNVFALAGIQNYSFLVQPQNLSWFYSQIYTSGAVGLGGEYPVGDWRLGGDGRFFAPVLVSERYGSGGAGGSGQSATASGYSVGLGVRRVLYSGGSIGLGYRGHFYESIYSGTGKRGPNDVTGVVIKDSFQAITATFSRGF